MHYKDLPWTNMDNPAGYHRGPRIQGGTCEVYCMYIDHLHIYILLLIVMMNKELENKVMKMV
jgi:hypothetical protein